MGCLKCARDLLTTANDALIRGDLKAVAQPLREAITEWDHEGEARAMNGELSRLMKLGKIPDIAYWLDIASRRVGTTINSIAVIAPSSPKRVCPKCPSVRINHDQI